MNLKSTRELIFKPVIIMLWEKFNWSVISKVTPEKKFWPKSNIVIILNSLILESYHIRENLSYFTKISRRNFNSIRQFFLKLFQNNIIVLKVNMTYILNGRFNELEKYQGTYFQTSYNDVVRKIQLVCYF